MKDLLKITAFALLCLLNLNCSKPELSVNPVSPKASSITLSKSSLSFPAEGGTETLTLSATHSWTVSCPSWATVTPTNGAKGDISLTLTVSENKGVKRQGELVAKLSSGKSSRVSLSQAKGADATPGASLLDGKRFIICANSMVYYGGLVEYHSQSKEDKGMFYKMMTNKGVNGHKVIDCTYGNHHLYDYSEAGCKTSHKDCPGVGVDLLKGLDLASFDYVIISESGNNNANFYTDAMTVFQRFTKVNPDVKLVYINHIYSVYKNHSKVLSNLKKLNEAGVTIINCGQLAYDIYTGAVKVPGGSLKYSDRYTFCNHTSSDTHHPNPLMGYIMTQMLYAALSGDMTPDDNWYSLVTGGKYGSGPIAYSGYYNKYYTTAAALPFMTVLDNKAEMEGIQKLIPQYINKF